MKMRYLTTPLLITLLFCSCGNEADNQVISQRFIHKYGYAVSKQEWESKSYPGQVVTTLRNGVTITATYENGVLHGPCSHTHPHSQTVQFFYLYNQGNLVKEIAYDSFGMPIRERIQISPTRYTLTNWYSDGTPMKIEDFAGSELLEGEYFTLNNEAESRVEKGSGLSTRRDQKGLLLSKEFYESGLLVKQETFYPNGSPETLTFFSSNKIHGERKVFTQTGEPQLTEEWVNGLLHGKVTHFMNGAKQMEISYLYGAKNGLEVHFIDGKIPSQEILWENDLRHGPSIYYIDGMATTEWYYDGKKISKKKYDELDQLDQMISKISSGQDTSSRR